jgi:hypothetical protein
VTDYTAAIQADDFDLRNVSPLKTETPLPKLGHAGRVTPKLKLSNYVHSDAPQVPKAVHRSHLEHNFPMYGNDRLSDCGEAMGLKGIEAFHLDAHTPVPPFTEADAERLYEEVGGYVPGDPATDNGTDNQVLVEWWQSHGVTCAADKSTHKIVATVEVDPKDVALNQRAIWEFVVLFRAVGLPVTAQGQRAWDVADPSLQGPAALGSWGYHDVPYLSYDGSRYRVETWGSNLLATYAFDAAYAVGGFVVVTEEQLDKKGMSPAGFDWTKLNADVRSL